MKNIILIVLTTVTIIFTHSCSSRYVDREPAVIEVAIPPRPSNNHIWIGNNWEYQRQSRNYTQHNGYWVLPNRGRTYTQGYWSVTPKGHRWVNGRWR